MVGTNEAEIKSCTKSLRLLYKAMEISSLNIETQTPDKLEDGLLAIDCMEAASLHLEERLREFFKIGVLKKKHSTEAFGLMFLTKWVTALLMRRFLPFAKKLLFGSCLYWTLLGFGPFCKNFGGIPKKI